MRNITLAHTVHKVTWLMLGFAGVIAAAIVLTSIVDAHDDDSSGNGATEPKPDTVTLYRRISEETYSPCAEILKIAETGEESGDLRELGMFVSVSGLPPIHSSRFQRCISNGLTGEVALSFLINDELTLVISNSEHEREALIDKLELTSQATGLQIVDDIPPGSEMRSSVYRNDPTDVSAVIGTSSFSINDLLRNEER